MGSEISLGRGDFESLQAKEKHKNNPAASGCILNRAIVSGCLLLGFMGISYRFGS